MTRLSARFLFSAIYYPHRDSVHGRMLPHDRHHSVTPRQPRKRRAISARDYLIDDPRQAKPA